ncbi:MAG: hypothetical protein QOE92_539 [Chloroflexota bacterium]|jgi:diguanylate cyclase (GGDEF)-like protein/PAS domain S-box-containing protein/putative nucleotidyltransferase with HDIG domain|nr:hypothetical protein [Chloroflexota bacterium]
MIGALDTAATAEEPTTSPRWMLLAAVTLSVILAITVTLLAAIRGPAPDLLTLLVLSAAALVAERFKVSISDQSPVAMSLTLSVMMTAVVLGGPAAAVTVGVCAALGAATLKRARPPAIKTLFNTALFAASAGAAGLAYQATGGNLFRPGGSIGLEQVGPWSAAIGVYVIVNWSLLLTVIRLSSGRRLRAIWREDFRWTPVQVLVSGIIGFALGTCYSAFGWVGGVIYLLPLVALRAGMRLYTSQMHEQIEVLRRAQEEVAATNDGLMKTLASVIDARDIYLYGHSVQASRYAREVAVRLGLPAEDVRDAEYGALLHDIGKIGISESIINKPARLDAAEYTEIQKHCEIGYHLLSNLPHFEGISQVVYSHHEQWDGRGYPRGLSGEDIPIAARIVSVVEATEAMVSDRPYRKGMTPDEVLGELADGAGSQWDARVVEAFSDLLSTDRKHLQMRNSALEVALRRPLSRLNPSTDSAAVSLEGISASFLDAGQPIFILDEAYRFVSVNPAAQRLTGWMEAQVQGQEWWSYCLGGRPAGAQATLVGTTREFAMRRRDGTYVQLEVTGSPLRTSSSSYWLIIGHDVSHRVRRESDLARQASTDHLTKLANRDAFERKAATAMAAGKTPLTVALVDLDGLKRINDNHGHLAGDDAIRKLARCLSASVRGGDVAARLGGDEFVLLLPGTREGGVDTLLERAAELAREASVEGVAVTFCAGAAEWDGRESLDSLVSRADARMYEAKRRQANPRVIPFPTVVG